MEFFDWVQVPWIVAEYLELSVDSPAAAVNLIMRIMVISVSVAAALYLVGLICGGIGLMKLAKRQNISYWWIGFLPFGNTFLIGKLAGETRVFGKKSKRLGLYAMIVEIIYVLIEIILLVLTFMLTRAEFYGVDATDTVFEFSAARFKEIYPNLGWVLTLQNVLEIIGYVWWFIAFFFMCSLYSAFFRKYFARSPFMMTFLCAVLPLKGYVLLAVRNNNPVDYTAYQQRQYEEMRRAQYGGYDEGGNRPFTDFGGGSNGSYGGGSAGDPFSEFGSGDSPNGSNGGSSGNSNGSGNSGSSNDSGSSPFSDF